VAQKECCFTSQEALAAACEELGCTYSPDQTDWNYYGEWLGDYRKPDAAYRHGIDPKDYGKNAKGVISLKGDKSSYEVGLYPHPSGQGLMPVYDFFGTQGRKIQHALGDKLEKLRKAYAEYGIRQQCRSRGYSIQKKVTADGHIQMIAEPR
jgi:hypothetical protein